MSFQPIIRFLRNFFRLPVRPLPIFDDGVILRAVMDVISPAATEARQVFAS